MKERPIDSLSLEDRKLYSAFIKAFKEKTLITPEMRKAKNRYKNIQQKMRPPE